MTDLDIVVCVSVCVCVRACVRVCERERENSFKCTLTYDSVCSSWGDLVPLAER